MMPIGPLMIEHRWIERVIADLQGRLEGRPSHGTIDSPYIARLVDFLRTYADRCHHGKEEDLLFRELSTRKLDPALAETMSRLVEDHQWARTATKELVTADACLAAGDEAALDDVLRLLRGLASFYPEHIRREDKDFFRPVMAYLTRTEQDAMLQEFTVFDASLIHERYRRVVEELEGETIESQLPPR